MNFMKPIESEYKEARKDMGWNGLTEIESRKFKNTERNEENVKVSGSLSQRVSSAGRWSSGYDAALTRRRSWVQLPPGPPLRNYFMNILSQLLGLERLRPVFGRL